MLLIIFGSIFGSIMTLIGSYLFEKRKRKMEVQYKRSVFSQRAKFALIALNDALEKLKVGYSYKNFYEFQRIDLFESCIEDIKFLKKDIDLLIPFENKREKLLMLTSDISVLAKNLRGTENFYLSSLSEVGKKDNFQTREEHTRFFEKQRTQHLIDMVDIKRRIDDFISSVL